jgi:hypothetical protein
LITNDSEFVAAKNRSAGGELRDRRIEGGRIFHPVHLAQVITYLKLAYTLPDSS